MEKLLCRGWGVASPKKLIPIAKSGSWHFVLLFFCFYFTYFKKKPELWIYLFWLLCFYGLSLEMSANNFYMIYRPN
jgi:hypothetical protein